jgi:hypothetical protein
MLNRDHVCGRPTCLGCSASLQEDFLCSL